MQYSGTEQLLLKKVLENDFHGDDWEYPSHFEKGNEFTLKRGNVTPGAYSSGWVFCYRSRIVKMWRTVYADSGTLADLCELDFPGEPGVKIGHILGTHYTNELDADFYTEGE